MTCAALLDASEGPLRPGLLKVFARWTLGHIGIWRVRPY